MPRAGARRDRPARGHAYFAHVVPGLEAIAVAEMRAHLDDVQIERTVERFDERTGLVLARYAGSPADLLTLRTTEDVFALAAESASIPAGRNGIGSVRAAVSAGTGVDVAASAALEVRQRRKGKPTFRVIARKSGDHAFRRVDLQRAVETGIMERFPGWRLVDDNAQLEIWVHLVDRSLILGFRLSDNTMRQREYRVASLPAALKPTVAAAMVMLSRPEDGDVVLDPMCGSGTILVERALAGRYKLLLGGDADPEAVKATRENIGPRYKPIEIRRWDATALPLGDASVSRVVCNLPFGKQIGTPAEIRSLYPALLDEFSRVLVPGGRMVLLTSERALLRRAIEQHPDLVLERQVSVQVRGVWATIFVIGSVHVAQTPA